MVYNTVPVDKNQQVYYPFYDRVQKRIKKNLNKSHNFKKTFSRKEAFLVEAEVERGWISKEVDFSSLSNFLGYGDVVKYRDSLTKTQRKIFDLFLGFRGCSFIKMSHGFISKQVGCSTITTRRAVERFCNDKIMFRKHKGYSSNQYYLSPSLSRSKISYQIWFNQLSKEEQELYITYNIKPKRKLHIENEHVNNKSIYVTTLEGLKPVINHQDLENFVCSSEKYGDLVSQNDCTAKITATVGLNIGRIIFKKSRNPVSGCKSTGKVCNCERVKKSVIKSRTSDGRNKGELDMLNENQKQWIAKNKTNSRFKEIYEEKIKHLAITEDMVEIQNILGLNEIETLKMIRYPDAAIGMTLKFFNDLKSRGGEIQNVTGYLYKCLENKTKELGLEVDYATYNNLTEGLSLHVRKEDMPVSEDIRSIKFDGETKSSKLSKIGYHRPFKREANYDVDKNIAKLKMEIGRTKKNIEITVNNTNISESHKAMVLEGLDSILARDLKLLDRLTSYENIEDEYYDSIKPLWMKTPKVEYADEFDEITSRPFRESIQPRRELSSGTVNVLKKVVEG